jgi:hypothetical protein
MKKFFLFIFIISGVHLLAQTNQTYNVSATYHTLLIGGSISPNYSFRQLNNADGTVETDAAIAKRNERDQYRIGFNGGVNLAYNFNASFGIEGGLHFAQKGYDTDKIGLNFPNDPDKPVSYSVQSRFNYLDVPLRANVLFGQRNLRFIASFGFVTDFLLLANRVYTYYYVNGASDREDNPANESYNKVGISPMASVGLSWRIKKRYYFHLEPTIRYSLTPVNAKGTAAIREKLWDTGLKIGLYYGL